MLLRLGQDLKKLLEPKLENRKETGMAVILFLIIMTGLGYLSYRKVWADIKKA